MRAAASPSVLVRDVASKSARRATRAGDRRSEMCWDARPVMQRIRLYASRNPEGMPEQKTQPRRKRLHIPPEDAGLLHIKQVDNWDINGEREHVQHNVVLTLERQALHRGRARLSHKIFLN